MSTDATTRASHVRIERTAEYALAESKRLACLIRITQLELSGRDVAPAWRDALDILTRRSELMWAKVEPYFAR